MNYESLKLDYLRIELINSFEYCLTQLFVTFDDLSIFKSSYKCPKSHFHNL